MKVYQLNGKIVSKPKAIQTKNGLVFNPTDDILKDAGYTLKNIKSIDSVKPIKTYEQKVVELIRQKYSINDELAILRQKDQKPEEYQEYYNYCENCKQQVKQEQE